jgi:hypothetical protein
LGNLQPEGPGGSAQPQVVGASPFIFTALVNGFLVVFAAKVEVSRDGGGTYYQVTLNGGAIPLNQNDKVRVTWFEAQAPTVTFFPNA